MTYVPREIKAGLTLTMTGTCTAYPADEWEFALVLRGAGVIDLTASAEGVSWVIEADATTTKTWAAGSYWYSLRASRAGEVAEVESGTTTVLADLADAEAGFDGRDHARKVLDAIEAVLENRATQDQMRYVIAGRELHRTPIADLLRLREYYRNEARQLANIKRGRSSLLGRLVRVRF